MKIVFLDVDGVLNHFNKTSQKEHEKYYKKLNGYYDFNYINVRWTKKYLKQCIKCGYVIIISSSWRNQEDCLNALYEVLGLDIVNNIKGFTKISNIEEFIFYGFREGEIIDYILDNNPDKVIIIDDDVSCKMNKFGSVIKTVTTKGFRKKHYKLGIKYLK